MILSIESKMNLLRLLPDPIKLEGLLPGLKTRQMAATLAKGNVDKIAEVTLIAILMGTVHKLMEETPDWQDYLDLDAIQADDHDCENCDEKADCESYQAQAKSPIVH